MSVVIDGNNGVSGNNGTAATPTLRGDDPDTGVFFPTANAVSLSTGGMERVSITNNYTLVKNRVELQSDLAISNDQGFASFSLNNGTLQLLLYTPLFNPGTFDLTGLFAISGNVGTSGHLLTSGGSGAAPSWSSVGTATAGLAYGAVGTYAFFRGPLSTLVTPGSTYAGSSMQASSIMNSGTYASTVTSGGNAGAASGTWRAVGGSASSTANVGATTLFLRIS
jgi:hypothetical protein